jgi:hypothetical protein
MSEEGEEGFYTTAQKLVINVLKRVPSVLPTRCRYYQGVSQKPNRDGLSVVPTPGRYYRAPGKNFAREGLSVILTPGRYYRSLGKNLPERAYQKYQPSVGTTDRSSEC